MAVPEFQGAFEYCPWCGGRGCNQCPYERRKWQEAHYGPDGLPQPIFEAQADNPHDLELLKRFLGREALEHAFGPEGGGIEEIEQGAAQARLIQALHRCVKETDDAGTPAGQQSEERHAADDGHPEQRPGG
jgi:hypothetical protein